MRGRPPTATVALMVTRRGGVLPLGDRRVGVPLSGSPAAGWLAELRAAMPDFRPDDQRWAHAAETASVDEVNGVPHIVLITSGVEAADFFMTYLSAIDAAIDAANAAST